MRVGKSAGVCPGFRPKHRKSGAFPRSAATPGCRPGELKELRKEDLRLEKRELTFRDTKNGTYRNVHITSDAAQMLYLQLVDTPDDSAFVFCTRARTGAWVPYNYSYGVKLLRKESVVAPDFRMHAGRREFISRAIESNVPYATIRKQTGHKSTQALEIYDEGLSTAPEIRAELDRLADKVQQESLVGAFEALCTTDEQRQKVREWLGEDKKNWVSFDGMAKRKSER
ncbi:tyrosine-type recombinase/integrase [Paludibacterium denitrificans]|uniref:Tyrosine-type recombinase/integrase n=1 Tax=Paludibacterium denitrificans TaxID=2675226 RepID=A0A844GCN8_9NEIS|nr:tyrosine-type recombinase/integrase [Paludibacterium denitrificans]MTD33409.1 tyrosine-type recombinase/integrase [Paludibacterium denitrificans]